ncbi:MAG: DUF997 domain-containing protein [Thermobacillus sp.]|uniref:F0F1-ATPase subunit (ATPase_gene1) n=1 Tax=Thermobacillus composti (strain DSM 18247 / JCM 13945 / KWC4) TaxID=717605 RepID=L0EI12_THECK|nr:MULTISPECIES: DUF997 family protein [Thermobacillus]AGA59878.1 hypothetical protein Theco_3867 [Thermobacillus composti KWC4]REK55457.1 MAG: DUF997 domain-containing protein [Thermobacillus sp.]
MNKKSKGDNPWRAAALVGAMGVNVAVCMTAGYWLGARLGGTPGWVVAGLLGGLLVGILSCVAMVKFVLGDSDG